ncbi:MAG TPA: pyrroline-5-carboxylate reductase [Rhodanobacteraceae bacterium]|nr:pyrroline-5-carboxylate reductase [Rhodanobacteraceae bacterium]
MTEHPDSITFIGGGNMARSLIGGLLAGGSTPGQVHVVEPRAEAREGLEREFGITTHAEADAVALASATLVLAIKPQVMRGVCEAIGGQLARGTLVISIAAGIRLAQIGRWLGGEHAIVRCMPNTPALIGAGASGLCASASVEPAQRERAERVLASAGLTCWVDDEALIDTVTGISGSGPAYFFAFVEALEDAGVAQGLPRDTARALACQTCLGAGRMLVEGDDAPAELRRKVTSPNGTTAAALDSLSGDDLAGVVARAVAAATRRGQSLSAELD